MGREETPRLLRRKKTWIFLITSTQPRLPRHRGTHHPGPRATSLWPSFFKGIVNEPMEYLSNLFLGRDNGCGPNRVKKNFRELKGHPQGYERGYPPVSGTGKAAGPLVWLGRRGQKISCPENRAG